MAILDDILAQIPQGAEASPWARQMLARMTSGDLVANPNDTPTPLPTPMQPKAPPAYPAPTAPKLPDQTPVPAPRMAAANGLPPIPETATGVQKFQAGLAGFKNNGLLGAFAGAMGADDVIRNQADTFRTLTANGIKPEMAALMIRSPDLFKSTYALQQQGKTETRQNDTAAWLMKKYGYDQALANQVAADPHLLQTYLAPGGPGTSAEYGLTPYFDENGKAYFPNKSGQLKEANVRLLAPGSKAEQVAAGTLRGKTVEQARQDLPQAMQTASDSVANIDAVLNHPALNRSVGPIDQYLPNVTADANDFQARLDQLKGGAFLTAFQSLRGGGQITEVEGKKATDAIARLNKGVSEAQFKQALTDLRNIATNAAIRAQVKAGVLPEDAMNKIVNFESMGVPQLSGKNTSTVTAPAPGRDPLAPATVKGTGDNTADRVNPDIYARNKAAVPPSGEYVFNPATNKLEPKR